MPGATAHEAMVVFTAINAGWTVRKTGRRKYEFSKPTLQAVCSCEGSEMEEIAPYGIPTAADVERYLLANGRVSCQATASQLRPSPS
jgi:hypothetical protein